MSPENFILIPPANLMHEGGEMFPPTGGRP
jgi:hypothetical protein